MNLLVLKVVLKHANMLSNGNYEHEMCESDVPTALVRSPMGCLKEWPAKN